MSKYLNKCNTVNFNNLLLYLKSCDSEFNPKLSAQISLDAYAEKIIKNAVIFEAWDEDKLIATVIAYINDFDSKKAFVTLVYCKKEYRRQGIITNLFDMLENKCKEKGFNVILLKCAKDNCKALLMYKKFGFTELKDCEDNRIYLAKNIE